MCYGIINSPNTQVTISLPVTYEQSFVCLVLGHCRDSNDTDGVDNAEGILSKTLSSVKLSHYAGMPIIDWITIGC